MNPSHPIRLIEFIRDRFAETGAAPSYDAMAAHLGLKSKSDIRNILVRIEQLGHIRLRSGHRALELVGFNLGVLSGCSVRELKDIIAHAEALVAAKSRTVAA